MLALVKKKIKAKQTRTITPPAPEAAEERSDNVIDLVALLQQSLGKKMPAAPVRKRTASSTSRKPPPARHKAA